MPHSHDNLPQGLYVYGFLAYPECFIPMTGFLRTFMFTAPLHISNAPPIPMTGFLLSAPLLYIPCISPMPHSHDGFSQDFYAYAPLLDYMVQSTDRPK